MNPPNAKGLLMSAGWSELASRVFYYALGESKNVFFLHSHSLPSGMKGRFRWLAAWSPLEYIRATQPGLHDFEMVFSGSQGPWFGYLGYDAVLPLGVKAEEEDDYGAFFLPEFWIAETHEGTLISSDTLVSVLPNPEDYFPEIKDSISHFGTCTLNADHPKAAYIEEVNRLKHHIAQGDMYEVNFCSRYEVSGFSGDTFALWQSLCRESPMPFSCFYRDEKIEIASASPERFLFGRKGVWGSEPMKGTRKRSSSPSKDKTIRKALQEDPKERAENIMIVDLVRNDLSRVAARGSVKVEALCDIYAFPNVFQMVSTVTCVPEPTKSMLALLGATFPMGSMTGAPKVAAMNFIRESEGRPRGAYSGAAGYFWAREDFEFNVLIRSFFKYKNRPLTFWVGSAITSDANPEAEWEECNIKASALCKVLGIKDKLP
jgi:para-aminobenzoate synthetase component 1